MDPNLKNQFIQNVCNASINVWPRHLSHQHKNQINKLKRVETNTVKSQLNLSLFCRHTSLLKAVNIKNIENRIYIAQLSLFNRLTQNPYTNSIIDELKSLNITTDFIKRLKVV